MGMRDIESRLPPGFRFYPSDEELVCHYLFKKVSNEWISTGATMMEVDLHKQEPWELPEGAKLSANEWYFFSFRDRKYATGSRTNRATKTGYWKATGKDRIIYEQGTQAVVGMRKTLVFYGGRAPNGIKTEWVMHEFRLENPHLPPKEDWVLCRVFHKTKAGTARFSMEKEQDELEMEEASFHCNSQTLDIDVGMRDYGIYQYDDNSPNVCQMNLLAAVLHHNIIDLYPATDNHNVAVQGLHLDNNKTPVVFGNTNGKNGVADDYRFLIEMGLVADRDPSSTGAAAAAESMIKQDCIIKSHI